MRIPISVWPRQTWIILAALALISTGFVILAGWPAAVIVLGFLLLAMLFAGFFD